ncbi:MAG: CHAT domain-containing protein [Blastocatellia bacterium]
MIKRRLLLLLMLILLLPAAALRSQDEDVLTRESDESATTIAERQRALTALLAASQQMREAGQAAQAARFLNRAGRLHLQLSSPHDAVAAYQEALSLAEQSLVPAIKADSLNGLGAAHKHLGDCDQAQAFLQQAIVVSEQSDYVAGKAEALLILSDCQTYSDHALALRTAQQALALFQSIDHKWGIAKSYAAVGEYQFDQNNLPEATASYEAALNLWRELKLSDQQAEALISLGYIEYRRGAWQNVFAFFTQAQALLDEQAEPYKMGQIHAGLANAFIESGMPETGLAKYMQALDDYNQTHNRRAVTAMIWGIGRANYILGNYEEARRHLENALAEAESIKENKIAALCNDFLGQTARATNDQTAALHYYEVALNLYTQAASPMEAARVLALIGQVYEQQGKVEQARAFYQSALKTFRALSHQINQSATLYALGSLELKQRRLNLAEDYLRQSIEVTENIRRVSTSRDLTAAFSATVYDRYEKYIDCLMQEYEARPAPDLLVRAFETSDVARGRSLSELLRATETNLVPGLDPQLAEREKSLRLLLRVKEDDKVTLLSKTYKTKELVALDADLTRLQAEYKEVGEAIQARYPAYGPVTRPVAWSLQQIQEQVVADDETVLLEYSFGSDQSYAWAVTREGIKSYRLPAGALINETAQRVYKLLAVPPDPNQTNDLNNALQELSAMVLSPVAAELNKRRILIVADSALHYIPFQALPTPQPGGESLVADYEIINIPSASILGELRQEATRRQPTKMLAAFGDPVFASNYAQASGVSSGPVVAMQSLEMARWQNALRDVALNAGPNGDTLDPAAIKPLFYAKRELATLRDAAAGGETAISSGFAASREQLLHTDLSQYAILYFATHGLLDPKRPENSGLLLSTVNRDGQAQNGFVGLQDIYGLRAPVDLVVLSACQTALGKDARGEGLLGLTRGFMYAGASSVMASLWKVDDEATAELMRQTYVNMLQEGMPPAAALRAAQNSIRQRPEWRSPYYWAGFTLQGEYLHVIRPASATGAAGLYGRGIVIGGLMLLALMAVWFYRRRQRSQAIISYSMTKK